MLEQSIVYFAATAAAALVVAAIAKQIGIASLSITAGAVFAFAVLEAVDLGAVKPHLGFSAVYPGHAPVTAILFAMPSKPAIATAFGVMGGHVVVTLTSLAQLYLQPLMPETVAFAQRLMTVGAAVLGMSATSAVHPPAAGFALAFVGGNKGPMDTAGPLIGCAILIFCQRIWLVLPERAAAGKKKPEAKAKSTAKAKATAPGSGKKKE